MVDKDCEFLCKARSWLRDRLITRGWLSVVLPLPVIIYIIFHWPNVKIIVNEIDKQNPQALYLLSTLAQSLAAVFALVFTVTLIVAQLSSKYSHRILRTYFDRITVAYVLFFILVIILVIGLIVYPIGWLAQFALILASGCLLCLIPYFLRFREKLDPRSYIKEQEKIAMKQLMADSNTVPSAVTTIYNVIMSAFMLKDYDTFESGIKSQKRLTLYADENRNGGNSQSESKIIQELIEKLGDACIGVIDDPIAARYIIGELSSMGMVRAERNSVDLVDAILGAFSDISEHAIPKKVQGMLTAISLSIDFIAFESIKYIKNPDELLGIMRRYSNNQIDIFTYAISEKQNDLAKDTVSTLNIVFARVLSLNLSTLTALVTSVIGEMGKTSYDKLNIEIARYIKFDVLKRMRSDAARLWLNDVVARISRDMEDIHVSE